MCMGNFPGPSFLPNFFPGIFFPRLIMRKLKTRMGHTCYVDGHVGME